MRIGSIFMARWKRYGIHRLSVLGSDVRLWEKELKQTTEIEEVLGGSEIAAFVQPKAALIELGSPKEQS